MSRKRKGAIVALGCVALLMLGGCRFVEGAGYMISGLGMDISDSGKGTRKQMHETGSVSDMFGSK